MAVRVQVQSPVYGDEVFDYESLEAALDGIKRIYTETVDSGDGLQRVIGLIAEGNCEGCSGRRWRVVAADGDTAGRRIVCCDLCSAQSLEQFEAVAMVVGFLHDFGCRIQASAEGYELSVNGSTYGSWPSLNEAATAGVQLVEPQLAV